MSKLIGENYRKFASGYHLTLIKTSFRVRRLAPNAGRFIKAPRARARPSTAEITAKKKLALRHTFDVTDALRMRVVSEDAVDQPGVSTR